ncbi:UDP-N-acetylglucosamine 1-carboxyvinyltransferase [Hathewaya proteolytica DSM 3090]|uniref:UDP-N-acetylglucosamine 1-carboxyvinyltransferase n=1 Tax=Hathewaya proteolytica DSM 3090 TaxID=1121331 RepID=A0A1M6S984_9CLOT|nr:UDP-N-acetylglucosamine 1-carboxyvinyltransferase [Hathewaya proteolytica]SHK41323.1 UDP-N-acetylglucosamine 1-carboxyvinyltransferase [Hathewaya proteolytica DSM 3090]
MDKFKIKGGKKLSGTVEIDIAKNAVLPIMSACILNGKRNVIHRVPMLEDVVVLSKVLKGLNANVTVCDEKSNCHNNSAGDIIIDSSRVDCGEALDGLVKKMRGSFLLMGPMLSRFGKCKIFLPGGCNIGSRPIDLHLKGFAELGAKISIGHGYVDVQADELIGNRVYLDFPSVGATENIMMCAVKAKGTTIIENCAEEPEIEDLSNFLNSMGAHIEGAGTDRIVIKGVEELRETEYTPIYDRIEAGTFMIAAAITKSKIDIKGINESHLKPVIAKLMEIGVGVEVKGNTITIDGNKDFKSVDIKTMPYPGFPTDMQSQVTALLSIINGTSLLIENIFENRFMHVPELNRMGANIVIDGRSAIIRGVDKLTGAEVKATDLRAGATLVLAALAADGVTVVNDIYHLDRGYYRIEDKLKKLGADIVRIASI